MAWSEYKRSLEKVVTQDGTLAFHVDGALNVFYFPLLEFPFSLFGNAFDGVWWSLVPFSLFLVFLKCF